MRFWFYVLIVVQVISAFLVLWFLLLRKSQARPCFYGLIVVQVTSTFSVLYSLIVVQVTSAFLCLWFGCGASYKRVLGFMV